MISSRTPRPLRAPFALFLLALLALCIGPAACTAQQGADAKQFACAVAGVLTTPFQALGGAPPCSGGGAWSGYSSQSYAGQSSEVCEVLSEDSACARCAKTDCCTQMEGLLGDGKLIDCLVGCRAQHSLEECLAPSQCGAADPAFMAAQSCFADFCTSFCSASDGGAP